MENIKDKLGHNWNRLANNKNPHWGEARDTYYNNIRFECTNCKLTILFKQNKIVCNELLDAIYDNIDMTNIVGRFWVSIKYNNQIIGNHIYLNKTCKDFIIDGILE